MIGDIHIKLANLRCCPFCGSSEVRLVEHRSKLIVKDPFYSIACPDCGADIYFYGAETLEYVTTARYNRRPANDTGNIGS